MNFVCLQGNLVEKVRLTNNQNGGLTAFGKIGVYNGKDRDGNPRESMFFEFLVSGRDAEILRDNTDKGAPILICGRLEEEKNTTEDGRVYINKKVICNKVTPCLKPVVQQAQPQYQQAPVQQVYTQPQYQQAPVQQYAQPVQQVQYNTNSVQQPGSPW